MRPAYDKQNASRSGSPASNVRVTTAKQLWLPGSDGFRNGIAYFCIYKKETAQTINVLLIRKVINCLLVSQSNYYTYFYNLKSN